MLPTPKSTATTYLLLCLLGAIAAPAARGADAPQASTTSGAPERGQRMQAVEATFGEPTQRYPAVGAPPISRWDYPGFVVYFENDRVVHAVRLTPVA